jgi:hypothetical protein
MERYSAKELRKLQREMGQLEKRTHSKPEKVVEKECLLWMRAKGWSVEIYEAKATFDPHTGRYRQQAMKAGTVDCHGNTDQGASVYVEFKAPGKLSTFAQERNYRQQQFLRKKIETNVFAVVVDSPERLERLYNGWEFFRRRGDNAKARQFLIAMVPTRVRKVSSGMPF